MIRSTERTVPPALAFVLALLLAGPAHGAEDRDPFRARFEITPFAGYRFGGQFRYEQGTVAEQKIDLGDAASFGFDLGLYRDGISMYELLYSRQSALVDTNGLNANNLKLRTEYYQIGGTLLYPQGNGLVTWFSFTAGATRFVPSGTLDGESLGPESAFSIGAGLGLRVPMNEHFSLTGGVRGYMTFIDTSTSLFCVSSGGATCAFHVSGSGFFQVEAMAGLTVVF